ncbi:50S ribosomal protein L30 [Candidatus Woesearchaeota archaeon]|nr:50S ribosomal protein L30 [Candidatus Woesearchaeota archaeon]
MEQNTRLAAIRVRGITGLRRDIKDTLNMLKLYKANYCIVVPATPIYLGMLKQAKDYITWGEIDDETFNILVEKRKEEFTGRETDSKRKIRYNNFVTLSNKKIKKYFRLSPPKKGYGRKGIKYPYQKGGALGYRGKAVNDLIKRMI